MRDFANLEVPDFVVRFMVDTKIANAVDGADLLCLGADQMHVGLPNIPLRVLPSRMASPVV